MASAEKIIEAIDYLGLSKPRHEFAVFGGACLALSGVREAQDLDLFVTKRVYRRLTSDGWEKKSFSNGKNPHLVGSALGIEVQAFSGWDCLGWQPDIGGYLENPKLIRELPCMPLDDLMEWKRYTARPKDLRDLALVDGWREDR